MQDNLNLTAEQVADLVRRKNPDYWNQFTDEQIIRAAAEKDPGVYKNIRFDTLGEKFYKQYGNEASLGFAERFSFQMGQLFDGTKTGMVGLFTPSETGEEYRKYSELVFQQKVAQNPEIQAYFAWKEHEPGWSNIDTWLRSASEAIPSFVVSTASTALAVALIPKTAGASLTMLGTAISMAPMFAMEAGNEYNEVMKLMVDEMGLDPKEAKKYATTASLGYGLASSFLERAGAKGFLKSIGIGSKVAKKTIADKMARAVVDAGVDRNFLAYAGTRLGAGAIRTVEGAFSEGLTEGAQALTQTATNRAIELGYGKDGLSAYESAIQGFKEAKDDPAVYEEAFAGALMGVGSGVKGVFSTKTTLDEIAAEEAKKREERVNKVAKEGVVTEVAPKNQNEKGIFKAFIEAATDPEGNMGEVISSVAKNSPIGDTLLAKAIRASESISNPSKKILRVLQDSPELIDEISKSKNSKQLLDLIYDDLNEAYGKENDGKKLPKAKAKIIAYIKEFASRGKLSEIIQEDSQFQEVEPEYEIQMDDEFSPQDEPSVDDTPNIDGEPQSEAVPLDEYNEERDGGVSFEGVTVDKVKTDKKDLKKTTSPNVGDEIEVFNPKGDSVKAKIAGVSKGGSIKIEVDGKVSLLDNSMYSFKNPKDPNYTIEWMPQFKDGFSKLTNEQIEAGLKRAIEVQNAQKEEGTRALEFARDAQALKNELARRKEGTEKKLDSYFEPNKRVILDTNDDAEVGAKVDGKKVNLTKPELDELSEAVKMQNSPVKITQGFGEVALLDFKRKLVEKYGLKDAPAPSQKIAKDDTVSLTKDIVNMLKRKKVKITKGYKAALKTLENLQNNKNVDNIKVLAIKPNTIVVQGFDKNGNSIGSKLSIPKIVGGNQTLSLTESKTSEEAPQIIEESPQLTGEIAQEIPTEESSEAPTEQEELLSDDSEPNIEEEITLTGEVSDTPGDTKPPIKKADEKPIVPARKINPETGQEFKDLEGFIDNWTFTTDPESLARESSLDNLWSVKDRPGINADKRKIYNKVFNERMKAAEDAQAASPEATKKSKNTTDQNIDDIMNRQNPDEDNVDFQDNMSSEEQLISENKNLAETILKRLKKFFPKITTLEFEGLIEAEGLQRIGFSLNKLAAWSTTDGRMDTMPHEYAHIYIKLMKNENIVKRGLKIFKSEENLVKEIGLYFVSRARDTSKFNKIKIWLKQFANRVKRFIGIEIKDENVFQFIAEEFYQGRWLGIQDNSDTNTIEYDTPTNETNTPNDETDGQTGGEADVNLTYIPNDLQQTHMFFEAIGVYVDTKIDYPIIIDMAKKAKSYGEYKKELMTWAKKLVDSRQYGEEKLKQIIADSKEDKLLRLDWLKQKSRIRRYIPGKEGREKGRQGNDTRVYQRWILDGSGVQVDGMVDLKTNKAHPETYTMNFIEQQFEGTQMRLFILPLKQILIKKNYKGTDYYHEAKESITEEGMEEIEQNYLGQYLNKFMKELSNIKSIKDLKPLMEVGNLLTVVGTKLGDNSAILSTKTTSNIMPTKVDKESFVSILDNQVEKGNISNSLKDRIIQETEAEIFNTLRGNVPTSLNLLKEISSMLKNTNDINVIKDSIMNIDGLKSKLAVNTIYSKTLARIKFWQEVRTPDYMKEGNENSAADSLTRMSIDMAEGIRPIGVGTGQLMVIDENVEVRVAKVGSDGKPIQGSTSEYRGKYKDYDGATFTGSSYLNKIAKNLGKLRKNGSNPLRQLKTFIRKRTVNDDGSVNYLGMKHMQFTPFKGMQFYDNDVLIAQVEGQGNNTYFKDMNPDSPTYGEKFDMIGSQNEAKVRVNNYKENNKLIPIDEKDIVVHSMMDKSKLSASHPIALGEMLLTIHDSREAKALLKQIEGRYSEVLEYYSNKINQFFEDPSKFREFIQTEIDANKVPTELQEYFELIQEDGMGIFHPALIQHILPVLNATIIRNGILKGRAWNNKSSLTYLKPAVHLKLEEGEVAVSGDNRVAIDEVERRYLQSEALKKIDWSTMGNNSPFDNKLTTLNKFLETNDVDMLIHRNPIAKVTGPVLRKIRSIVKGNQGEVIFMSKEDVLAVLDGDWDGDKAAFEFISDSHVKAMKNWQNSDIFAEVDKQSVLDIWGLRTDKDKKVGDTSVISRDDMINEVLNNAKSQGGTGVMVNAKTLMSQLFAKDFKINLLVGSVQQAISIANPNESTIMDYKPLDKDQLNHENLKILKKNGDSIVTSDGKKVEFKTHKNGQLYLGLDTGNALKEVYLKTTKSHEISILFQMAVDAVKYRHWGEIISNSGLNNFDFMVTKIFERANGQPLDGNTAIDAMMRKTLGLALNIQNISQIRQGQIGNNSAKYEDNLLNSRTLKERMYDENDDLLDSKTYAERFQSEMLIKFNPKKMARVVNLRIKNKPSPAEQLITGIDMKIGDTQFHAIYDNKVNHELAHTMAMSEMWESIKNKKEYSDYISDTSSENAVDVWNFIHKKRIFEKSDKPWSFLDIWQKLQKDMKTDDNNSARSDLNANMTNFVDRFQDEWNKLSSISKSFATLEMLSGFKSQVNILKIPPLKLMDKKMLKIYLPAFERNLRSFAYTKKESVKKTEKQTRIQLQYVQELNQMFDEQEQDPLFKKACKVIG